MTSRWTRRPGRALDLLAGVAVAALVGCKATVRHQVDPIHITLDVNLKVDRELNEFFAFEDEIEREVLESMPETTVPPGTGEASS